jgi:ABC-2 type transport system permease protein
MLGGCMWPLEIVPDAMRTAGHFVPHAWAIDAWTTVLSRGGDLFDIGRQVLVLLAFALGLLMISTQRLRHRIAA